jgi:hypothetical protein
MPESKGGDFKNCKLVSFPMNVYLPVNFCNYLDGSFLLLQPLKRFR